MQNKNLKYKVGDKVVLVQFLKFFDPEFEKYLLKTARIEQVFDINKEEYDYTLAFKDNSFDVIEKEIVPYKKGILSSLKVLYAKI